MIANNPPPPKKKKIKKIKITEQHEMLYAFDAGVWVLGVKRKYFHFVSPASLKG